MCFALLVVVLALLVEGPEASLERGDAASFVGANPFASALSSSDADDASATEPVSSTTCFP